MGEIIFNLNALLGKLDKLNDVALNKAINRACIIVENAARENAPADTGELRRSIMHEVEDQVGYVGTNLSYAPYVEYGTGVFSSTGDGRKTRWSYQDEEGNWHSTIGQRPQPFLSTALNDNKEKVLDEIKNTYLEEIKNA